MMKVMDIEILGITTKQLIVIIGAISAIALYAFIIPYTSPRIVEYKGSYEDESRIPFSLPPPSPLQPPPTEWIHIAHIDDPVGDHVTPGVGLDGVATGGAIYLGADILNVTLFSPFLSKELRITVYLNGTGKNDPTIDKRYTQINVEFSGRDFNGRGYVRYDETGWGSVFNVGAGATYDFSFDWSEDNRVELSFKGTPLTDLILELTVSTEGLEPWCDREVLSRVFDQIVLKAYGLGRGISLTGIDFSRQIAPLINSSMRGMDVRGVDVYRGGRFLNVTVTLSDKGILDDTIPTTFNYRGASVSCRARTRTRYPWRWDSLRAVSKGWIDATTYCSVFDIEDILNSENGYDKIAIGVGTGARFPIIIDLDENIREEKDVYWSFDGCDFELDFDEIK